MVRWVLAWNDLPAFAKPEGFHEIAHEYECGNGSDPYCAHTWLYVSADRTYSDAIRGLEGRYRAAGWTFSVCSVTPDTCSFAMKGTYADCLSYTDFKIDYSPQREWRSKFQNQIDASASTLLVTRGCV